MYNSVFSDVAFKLTPSNRLFHFDDDGHFILDQPLDFEDTPVHRLSVKAFNPRGNPSDLTTTMDMTIRVSNINEAPVFSKYVPPSNPIPENDESVIARNTNIVQEFDTLICSHLCIFVLKSLSIGKTHRDILNFLTTKKVQASH